MNKAQEAARAHQLLLHGPFCERAFLESLCHKRQEGAWGYYCPPVERCPATSQICLARELPALLFSLNSPDTARQPCMGSNAVPHAVSLDWIPGITRLPLIGPADNQCDAISSIWNGVAFMRLCVYRGRTLVSKCNKKTASLLRHIL